ncbi:MAG: aspartate kinase, partial [Firmicutes bacterium]|nr:aspartate kinase [Bacillota bacterium]
MAIVVQKFGGTSVATPEARQAVIGKIREAMAKGYQPVVVVSAMGRAGQPYATDTLIGLVKNGDPPPSRRELDLLMACGEIISVSVMVQALRTAGIEAVGLTGGQAGIVTDATYGEARILEVRPDNLLRALREGKVPVVAGFQGMTAEGEITTLGRGGSDTTAAALAAALGAELLEIFTDVEGVMTADPRLVPGSRPLAVMTYTEICEMAHLGAKVVHPRAVEIAMGARVPIRIRSTFSSSLGTLITDGRPESGIEIKTDKVVTGIAHRTGVGFVEAIAAEDLNATGRIVEIFTVLAKAGISVDMIHAGPLVVSFIIEEDQLARAAELLASLQGLTVRTLAGLAKVSVVGAGMRGVPGVMARVARALNQAGIAILG